MIETAMRWLTHHSQLRLADKGGNDGELPFLFFSSSVYSSVSSLATKLTGTLTLYTPSGIIMGVSSFEQLESNLKDLEKGPLPEDVVKALDEAWMIAKSTAVAYWHGTNQYTYELTPELYTSKK